MVRVRTEQAEEPGNRLAGVMSVCCWKHERPHHLTTRSETP
jgi:hypothetical protein